MGTMCVMTSIVISFILTGYYNVSFGSPYVPIGISCEPKSSLSYWQGV